MTKPLEQIPSPVSLNRNSSSKYPTKEDILGGLARITEAEEMAIKRWKKDYYKGWNKLEATIKIQRIKHLLMELAVVNKKSPLKFTVDTKGWRYYPAVKTIGMSQDKPSIISGLHELGHHFFGESELKACQYSISVFKTCFPSAFEKLEWKGHMLTKKNNNA